jgi:hypothetical protein
VNQVKQQAFIGVINNPNAPKVRIVRKPQFIEIGQHQGIFV